MENFRELFFEQPVFVQQGVVYHFVFKNTSRDPKSNFVSVDDFISSRSIRTKNKIVEDPLADAVLSKFGGDSWTVRQRHWSIGEYLYEDGRAFGNGYMGAASVDGPDRASKYLRDSQSIRQTVKMPFDLEINSFSVAAMYVSGKNEVNAQLIHKESNEVLVQAKLTGFPKGSPSGNSLNYNTLKVAEFSIR